MENMEDYLNVIEQTISHKYVIKTKTIINQEFKLKTLTLVNTGAYRNIIRESLIPTRYYDKKLLKYYLLQMNKG